MSAETTRQTQHAFRAILDALARPTRPFPISGPAAPFSPALAAVALTLCDEDTPVYLDPAIDSEVAAWFAFYTGAPVIAEPAEAAFLFSRELPSLDGLRAGTHEQPHQSATVVLEVAGQEKTRLRATGPGIDGRTEFDAPWAGQDFVDIWRRNTARFPIGVDLLLVEGDQIRGLPRTTTLEGVA